MMEWCLWDNPLGERSHRRKKQGRWEGKPPRGWDTSGFGALKSRALVPLWGSLWLIINSLTGWGALGPLIGVSGWELPTVPEMLMLNPGAGSGFLETQNLCRFGGLQSRVSSSHPV